MKNIIIMRHAKSDWSMELDDIDRPLNKRGEKAAPLMGNVIKERGLVPELILCSPAIRAKQTLKLVMKSSGFIGEVQFFDNFYYGDENDIFNTLKSINQSFSRILVIGHNPILENLVKMLNTDNSNVTMPTATIAYLSININDWKELKVNSCKLNWVLYPKGLDN